MQCQQIQQKLHAFARNGTTYQENEWINSHLANCAKCRTLLQYYHAAEQIIHDEKDSKLSGKQVEQVIENVWLSAQSPKRQPTVTIHYLRKIAAILIVALGIPLGVYLGLSISLPGDTASGDIKSALYWYDKPGNLENVLMTNNVQP